MELIERLPLREINFLNDLDFKTFRNYSGNCKNEDERKIKFDILKNYCKTNIKTRGETTQTHTHTHTHTHIGGGIHRDVSDPAVPLVRN